MAANQLSRSDSVESLHKAFTLLRSLRNEVLCQGVNPHRAA